MEETKPKISNIDFHKADNFSTAYANHVSMEGSLWDLKLVFGQNDQQLGPNAVVQHTAITLPWAQIKVLTYFMKNHLAAHEIQNGRIVIPPNLVPVITGEIPKESQSERHMPEIIATFKANYDSFIAENPEASPLSIPEKSKK
jgi:hypothetical protein